MYRKILKMLHLHRFRKKFRQVSFGKASYFEYHDNIHFTGVAYVGPHAYWSGKGGIDVGNNVIFAPKTEIWTSSHNIASTMSIPYGGSKDDLLGKVTIGDSVWIGLGATILRGVTIGEGAVIGARAVVAKDVPSCAIVVGNPGRIIGYRDVDLYNKLKSERRLYLVERSK